jgi:hypothetical protein
MSTVTLDARSAARASLDARVRGLMQGHVDPALEDLDGRHPSQRSA